MIVLGIDPGVANTGYGVVAHQRGRVVALALIAFGVWFFGFAGSSLPAN